LNFPTLLSFTVRRKATYSVPAVSLLSTIIEFLRTPFRHQTQNKTKVGDLAQASSKEKEKGNV
jgi:hypothetical protein